MTLAYDTTKPALVNMSNGSLPMNVQLTNAGTYNGQTSLLSQISAGQVSQGATSPTVAQVSGTAG